MDLNEQAGIALEELLLATQTEFDGHAETIARMMWLSGYKAGMEAVGTIAQASFERLQAELS